MAQPTPAADDAEAITPYSMHVSQRYLDLTRQKLALTRLPREISLPEARKWDHGTPKSVLEPLLDFWLEGYDWRAAESIFNTSLPQFRTTIASLRIHFVHVRSKHASAIPLLYCHSWPSSFIEVQRLVAALTDPPAGGQAFHVVVPSIPGFGFSDASTVVEFGVRETAEVFDALMGRLGYAGYVAHGIGWGFAVCRGLAMGYPERCRAVHTANPSFAEPARKRGVKAYLKWKVAKMTKGKVQALSFGYLPGEVAAAKRQGGSSKTEESIYSDRPLALTQTLHRLYSMRPQTLSFSLCDSPVGLLAALLDVIHTRTPAGEEMGSRSMSPFLSPVEMEMEMEMQEGVRHEESVPERNVGDMGQADRNYVWSPTEVLNWVMMQWLPGPESSLRWLRQAYLDTTAPHRDDFCGVPLGISTFHSRHNSESTPLMWGSSSWQMGWVKRHQRPATLPAWEAPDLLVLDLREWFGTLRSHGKLASLPHAAG